DIAAGNLEAVQASSGSGDEDRVLPADVVRHAVQGIHVMHRVLGEAAVDGQAAGAMPLGDFAVIQARRVHAQQAVVTPSAAFVSFDGHPVTCSELVDV